MDLENHISITSAHAVRKIVDPLTHLIGLKHFRYLKLYDNGSRIMLSNYPDCVRFIYGSERYKLMWFDGEFPQYLKEGHYPWKIMKLTNDSEKEEQFEQEINKELGLYHGVTLVFPGLNYHEVFSFDAEYAQIYNTDIRLFSRFILYFKQQAEKLIQRAEHEKIDIPILNKIDDPYSDKKEKLIDFLEKTQINRYYLKGQYSNIYLTAKEINCIYWLIQGKTAEETAMIESVSTRTVQCHLENIKGKLGCYKQTQLIRIILESGVFEIINYSRNFL